MKIILDTNVLVKYPKLLSSDTDNTTYIITTDVLNELNKNRNLAESTIKTRMSFINDAVKQGIVEIINPGVPEIQEFARQINAGGLSATDLNMLTTALYIQNNGYSVSIATFDKEIISVGPNLNLKIIRDDEIQLLLQLRTLTRKHSQLNEKIDNYEKKQFRKIIIQSIESLSLGLLATLISGLHGVWKLINTTIHIWGVLVLFFLLALMLYLWRERAKFSYGVFEFAVGFFAIVMVLWPQDFNYEHIFIDAEIDLKILGGLYIMVRGQDNLVKGLKGTKTGLWLNQHLKVGL